MRKRSIRCSRRVTPWRVSTSAYLRIGFLAVAVGLLSSGCQKRSVVLDSTYDAPRTVNAGVPADCSYLIASVRDVRRDIESMGEFGLSRISIVDAEAWLRNALEKLGHRFVDGGDPVYAKDSIDVTLKLAWTRASATARATNVVVGLLPAGGEVVEYFRGVNTSMGLSESATALKGSFDTALSRALQKAGLASTEGC